MKIIYTDTKEADFHNRITDVLVKATNTGDKTLAELGYLFMNDLYMEDHQVKLRLYFALELATTTITEFGNSKIKLDPNLNTLEGYFFTRDREKAELDNLPAVLGRVSIQRVNCRQYEIKDGIIHLSDEVNAHGAYKTERKEVLCIDCDVNIALCAMYDLDIATTKMEYMAGSVKKSIIKPIISEYVNAFRLPVFIKIEYEEDNSGFNQEQVASSYISKIARARTIEENARKLSDYGKTHKKKHKKKAKANKMTKWRK